VTTEASVSSVLTTETITESTTPTGTATSEASETTAVTTKPCHTEVSTETTQVSTEYTTTSQASETTTAAETSTAYTTTSQASETTTAAETSTAYTTTCQASETTTAAETTATSESSVTESSTVIESTTVTTEASTTESSTAVESSTFTTTEASTTASTTVVESTSTETTATATPTVQACGYGTAFGYEEGYSTTLDTENGQGCNRWGWYENYTLAELQSGVSGILYVGAGGNNLTAATNVGTYTAAASQTGGVTVTYNLDPPYGLAEVHIDLDCLPIDKCAPGQYTYGSPNLNDVAIFANPVPLQYPTCGSDSEAYLIIHAAVDIFTTDKTCGDPVAN